MPDAIATSRSPQTPFLRFLIFVAIGGAASLLAGRGGFLPTETAEPNLEPVDFPLGNVSQLRSLPRRGLLSRAAAAADSDGPFRTLVDVSWSSDGSAFLSRHLGTTHCGSPLLWHRAGGDVPVQAVRLPESGVRDAILEPDGTAAVIVAEQRRVWRVVLASDSHRLLYEAPVSDEITALALSATGEVLAVALKTHVVLLDAGTGREAARFVHSGSMATDIAFSADGERVAAGYADGRVCIWVRSSGELLQLPSRHLAPVKCVRFTDGSGRLLSIGIAGDDTLREWDVPSGTLLWQAAAEQLGLYALAVTADGELAATGGLNNDIELWDLRRHVRLGTFSGHEGLVRSLQFSPDAARLMSASDDGSIREWDVESTTLLKVIEVATLPCAIFPAASSQHVRP